MLEKINLFLDIAVNYVWSTPVILTLIGVGLLFTLGLGFIQFRGSLHAIAVLRGKYKESDQQKGGISSFEALTTALSATVGLGNISGVAVAISYGGPGSILWLVFAAFIGMATKYAEATLAVKFRQIDSDGNIHGGPMYYIVHGLGEKWKPLAIAFSLMAALAPFGGPNMFQTNQVAAILHSNFSVSPHITGLLIAILTAIVTLGGIKRIGKVTSKLIPGMIFTYLLGSALVISMNIEKVPEALAMIFTHAFTGTAAVGAFHGIAVKEIMIFGMRRACFSNEAGMGSAPMAHAAAATKEPAREGVVALLEPFIDSMISLWSTVLVILISGVWMHEDMDGVIMTAEAFNQAIPGFGQYFMPVAVFLFGYSTLLSWSYYGETSINFLLGPKAIPIYRILFCAAAYIGAIWSLKPIISFSDMLLGLMSIPNLIALIFLFKVVRKETQSYFQRLRNGDFNKLQKN